MFLSTVFGCIVIPDFYKKFFAVCVVTRIAGELKLLLTLLSICVQNTKDKAKEVGQKVLTILYLGTVDFVPVM